MAMRVLYVDFIDSCRRGNVINYNKDEDVKNK
jgi:hypothetical protein